MPEPGFTMQELLQQVFELDVEFGESITTREFMELANLGSTKSARRRLRPLVSSGVLVPVKRRKMNMAGWTSTVPAYAINPDKTWEDVLEMIEKGEHQCRG